MKTETADFYDSFFCLADQCPQTCCANWKIPIDPQTQARYRRMPGELGARARHALHRGYFRNLHGRCPFLRRDGLCEWIVADASQESVSAVCRTYPRKIQTYGAYRQISLSVSCPQAARLTLQCADGFSFQIRESEESPAWNDIDAVTFTMLQTLRRRCIGCLRNRKESLRERVEQLLCLAGAQPRRLREETRYRRLFCCMKHLETSDRSAARWLREPQLSWEADAHRQRMQAFMAAYPQITSDMENLLVYAIDRYLLEAVADADAAARIRLSIVWCWMLLELDLCCFRQNKSFTQAEQIRLLTMFARQTEHSDRNLGYMMRKSAWIL